MIDETIDNEIARLISARASWQTSDPAGAQTNLNLLDKTLLPAQIATLFPKQGDDPSQFIEQALAYYVSIFRLGYRAASVPEIPEDVIVNAINKYWKGSTAFYAAAVIIAALFGGTAVGLVQMQGASATIQSAKTEANNALAEADRTKDDIDTKRRNAIADINTLVDQQKADVTKKIDAQIAQSVEDLKNNLKASEAGHLKDLDTDFGGKKADFDAQAVRKIDDAIKVQTDAVKQQVDDSVKAQSKAATDEILKNLRVQAKRAEQTAGLIESCYTEYLTQAANPAVSSSHAAKTAEIKRLKTYCGVKAR